MAVSTVDGLINGMVPPIYINKGVAVAPGIGVHYSLARVPGIPGAISTSTAGVAGEIMTGNVPGALPWTRPSAGKTYIIGSTLQVSQPGTLMLCDLLWRNSGLSTAVTTPQTVNSIPWPARDKNFTTLGEDVFVGVEIIGTATVGTPTLTTTFTASDGTTGNNATNLVPTSATAAGGFLYVPSTSKTGMRSVQSFTLSSTWTSASISLMAYRVMTRLEIPLANVGFTFNFPFEGAGTVPTDACLFWIFLPTTASSPRIYGSLLLTQG